MQVIESVSAETLAIPRWQEHLVAWEDFKEVCSLLTRTGIYGLDSETTGLRPFHGDRLFSLIIATDERPYYFNFGKYANLPEEYVLERGLLALLKPALANPASLWNLHSAKFDMHMLANEGLEIGGTIHCTQAAGLLEYNQHQKYSLDACLRRIGMEKDDAVAAYLKAHPALTTKIAVAGKKQRVTLKNYAGIPIEIIAPYGCSDATGTRTLGAYQVEAIGKLDAELPPALPRIATVLENERRLTKTIFRMERHGLRVDRDFCVRAAAFEQARSEAAEAEFKALTGKIYSASPKLWADVFAPHKEQWQYTDKGNPSFESEIIESFDSPVAASVLTLRNAKAKSDFYTGFLYHADANDRIHPKLNQDGTVHGRGSSSEPNMQNCSKEKAEGGSEFTVRRAVIPSEGFFLTPLDYRQAELRLLLDLAGEMELIERIKTEGLDVHQAIATAAGIDRDMAKTVNFGLIYGQGLGLLAKSLKVNRTRAVEIRELVLGAMPKVAAYNAGVMATARKRGWVFNYFGRRCHFPDHNFAYTALNHVIAGGCADFVKVGMNRIDDYLQGRKSRMIWNVHDENLIEVAYGEEFVVPEIKHIMETSYAHRHLPMEVEVLWSPKSWAKADLKKMGV